MGLLRLFLALSVVMNHGRTTLFGFDLLDGAGAVLVFFTISGFLITFALLQKYEGQENGYLGFYWNRVVRLFPVYWVWLLISVVLYVFEPFGQLSYQGTSNVAFWTDNIERASTGTLLTAVIANITSFPIDALLALDFSPLTGGLVPKAPNGAWSIGFVLIGQFWSVSVELFFYFLAPLVVRSPLRVALMFVFSISGAFHYSWELLTAASGLPLEFQFLRGPESMWMFMLGSILAHGYAAMRDTSQKRLTCIVLGLSAFLYIITSRNSLFPSADFPWWQFASLTAAIPILFHLTRRSSIDGFIGSLSYPVYVVHFQLIQILGTLLHPNGALFAAVSILVSAIAILAIDRPISKFKWRGQ